MHKPFLVAGALFGGLAVILGAFGAHGLEKMTTDEKILHGFQTAVQYQMYHALALLIVATIYERLPDRLIKWSGNLFILGSILFSGSLYLLTALKINDSSLTRIAGPITPIGGIAFILGWLFLLIAVIKRK